MKKLFLIISFSLLFSIKTYAIPFGQWLNEIVGYTCIESAISAVPISNWPAGGPEGLCYKNYVLVCHSWLWETSTSTFSAWGSWTGAGGSINPPNPYPGLIPIYETVASFYNIQHNNNVPGINTDWLNPTNLQNE